MDTHMPSDSSINSNAMSVDDPAMVYNCKWSWCRLSFSDCNALTHHVIFEHVRRATPVRRRDILMLRRTEEGLGESIKLSDIMHDPSSSLSQKSCPSKEYPSSSQQPPRSSSLSSQPVSSPLSLPQHGAEVFAGVTSQPNEHTTSADVNPTFTSLDSPGGSLASLEIPPSPSFSSLVGRPHTRKPFKELGSFPRDLKRIRRAPFPHSQESISSNSTGSQRLVEEQLTQSSPSVSSVKGREVDSDSNEEDEAAQSSGEDVVLPTPNPSVSMLESSERDPYGAELNWDASERNSSQPNQSQPHETPIPQPNSLSQPPSQLQLSPSHSPKMLMPISEFQTDMDSSLALPSNTPVPLSSPIGFAISTPQRQNRYLRPPKMKISSRTSSGEETPRPSRKREGDAVAEAKTFSRAQPEPQIRLISHPPTTPIPKKPVFRSGILRVTPGTTRPQTRSQSPAKSRSLSDMTTDEDALRAAAREDVFTWNGSQSQSDSQLSTSQEFASYPPLQTQAPYQSQGFSQLD